MSNCNITNKKLKQFMSFGKMPLANGFLKKRDLKKEKFYKLNVGFNEKISLFQLNDFPATEKMFNKNYPFYTGSSLGMIKHFKNYAEWIKKNYLKNNNRLIEIGSNDGTFLSNFKAKQFDTVGFEPSANVASKANKNKIKTINKFFNSKNLDYVKNFKKKN